MLDRDVASRAASGPPGATNEDGAGLRHDVLAARAAHLDSSLDSVEPSPAPGAGGGLPAGTLLRAGLGVAALGLVAVTYAPTFEWMLQRWSDDHGYYGHGPLIPLVSGWLAWRDRARLVPRADRAGLALGVAGFVAAALLQVAAAAFGVHFASGLSLFALLVSAALAFGGTAFARRLAFPLGFLLFALPAPMLGIAKISLQLKLIAARLAIAGLGLGGLTAVREGSVVHMESGDVMVEDVCSGLRSLIALLAMGVLVAGVDPGIALWRRAALVLFSVPVAIVANAVRVAFLCVAVHLAGPKILDTWLHDGSGFVVYGLSLALLLSARHFILTDARPAEPVTTKRAAPPVLALAVLVALLAPAAAATRRLDQPPRAQAAPVVTGLPLDMGDWKGTELEVEAYVREVLETNDLISRRYVKTGADPVFVYAAASRGDRKVAHPPEVCLSGQGWSIEELPPFELARGVQASRLVLVKGQERQLVVYFYAAGQSLGPSYLGLQLWAALERFRSPDVPSALMRMSARVRPGEPLERVEASIRDFGEALVPALRTRLVTEENR